jgi:uncharacterized protein (TIGR02147 family)
MKSAQRPLIYSFHDYREYLAKLLDFLKSEGAGLSLRSLADQAEISVATLSMILSDQRNLTKDLVNKLRLPLGLDLAESSYLNLLTVLTDDHDPKARVKALKGLQKFEGYKAHNNKELEAFRYLSKWYYVAIRELATLPGFKAEVSWIQGQLSSKLSPVEIRGALDFLFDNKFLVKTKGGQVKALTKSVDCLGGVYRLSLAQFHSQIFEQGIESIHRDHRDERMILGHTFCVSDAGYQKISQLIGETLQKIQDIESQDQKPDRLYHVGLAAFPLSKAKKRSAQ